MGQRLGTNDVGYDASRLNTLTLNTIVSSANVDAITDLTGDVIASGPGIVGATLRIPITIPDPAVTSGDGVFIKHTAAPFSVAVPAGSGLSLIDLNFKNTGPATSQYYGIKIQTDDDVVDTGAGVAIFNAGRADSIYINVAGKASNAASNTPTGVGIDINKEIASSSERASANSSQQGIQIFDWSTTNQGVGGPRGILLLKIANRNTDHWLMSYVANRRAAQFIVATGDAGYDGSQSLITVSDETTPADWWQIRADATQIYAKDGAGIQWITPGSKTAYIIASGNDLKLKSGGSAIRFVNQADTDFGILMQDNLDVIMGLAGSTSATHGFPHMPAAAGIPAGSPTTYAGWQPYTFDTTNNDFYVFNAGWRKVGSVNGITGTGTTGRVAEFSGTTNVAASTLAKTGAGLLTLSAAGNYTVTAPETLTLAGRDVNNVFQSTGTNPYHWYAQWLDNSSVAGFGVSDVGAMWVFADHYAVWSGPSAPGTSGGHIIGRAGGPFTSGWFFDLATIDGWGFNILKADAVTQALAMGMTNFKDTPEIVTFGKALITSDAYVSGALPAPRGTLDVGLPSSTAESIVFGFGSSELAPLRIVNTRRLNYADALLGKNINGVVGSDNYATHQTTTGAGYSGIEFRYGGDILIYAKDGATTAASTVTPDTRIMIHGANGYIGVGTQSMSSIIHVYNASPIISLQNTGTGDGGLQFYNNSLVDIGGVFSDGSSGSIKVSAYGASNALWIAASTGNVLIGTVTDGMTSGGSFAIAKDLAHRGTLTGFFNATPVAQQTGNIISGLNNLGLFSGASLKLSGIHASTPITYISGAGTAGADNTAQTVKSLTLPANTLTQVGDRLRIRAYWTGDTGSPVTGACLIGPAGSEVLVSHTTDGGGATLQLNEVWLHYIDNTHANVIENEAGALGALSAPNVAGFTWASAQSIIFTQDAIANNHTILYALIVDMFPKGV